MILTYFIILVAKLSCNYYNNCFVQFKFSSINTSSCKVDLEILSRLNRQELDRQLKDPESLKLLCNQLKELVLRNCDGEFVTILKFPLCTMLVFDQHQNKVLLLFLYRLSANSPALSNTKLINLLQWGLPRMSRLEDFLGDDLKYIWFRPSLSLLQDTAKNSPEKFSRKTNSLPPSFSFFLGMHKFDVSEFLCPQMS